jgi:hypothetical protein
VYGTPNNQDNGIPEQRTPTGKGQTPAASQQARPGSK